MTAITFRDVTLPLDGFSNLEREAATEDHKFLTRLHTEWQDSTNRFDAPGECLLGAFADATLIAIGGLNLDPFADAPDVGRLRHIYVLRDHRRCGIAAGLVRELLARNTHFQTIRLRTPNADASHFYETLGFTPITDETATHTLMPE